MAASATQVEDPYDDTATAERQGYLMVDPNESLPYASRSHGQSQATKASGMEGTPSKKRRPVGGGPNNQAQPPAAPEAPRAPPVSYKAPPATNGLHQSSLNHPTSFAERARTLIGRPDFPTSTAPDSVLLDQATKRERRASLNRPIGGVYSEIQKYKRDSQSSAGSGPTSPRRTSFTPRTQPFPSAETTPVAADNRSAPQQALTEVSPPSSQSTAIRRSPLVERTQTKEWASDRSPLQKLEVKLGDISKEEKRARVQLAEQRLRKSRPTSDRPSPRSVANAVPSSESTPSRRVSVRSDKPQPLESLGERRNVSNPEVLAANNRSARSSDNRGSYRAPQGQGKPHRIAVPQQRGLGLDSNSPTSPVAETRRAQRGQPQPERGVRFQRPVSNAAPADIDLRTQQADLDDRELDPNFAEARAARREQLRQENTVRRNPPQAQTSMPRSSQQRKGAEGDVKPSANTPPLQANDAPDRSSIGPVDRKHHLSSLLHRPPGKEERPAPIKLDSTPPQTLSEWRQAGTARLTAPDFRDEETTGGDQGAWWENGGSGRRRKSQRSSRSTNKDAEAEQPAYLGSTGKHESPSDNSSRDLASPTTEEHFKPHVRPYVETEDFGVDRQEPVSGLRNHAFHVLSQLKRDKQIDFSSVYSYSCPNLALHDSSHPDHICEPFLSKELMMSMRGVRVRSTPGVTTFNPPLYLKCGPLLRYTGIKRDRLNAIDDLPAERETWRGSVMIVTADTESKYDPAPTLRLYPEPIDLVPPPPRNMNTEDPTEVPSEFTDPIAGLPKLARTGKTIYVKPVDDLEEAKDLSKIENDDGLFEETRTAAVPTSYGTPDYRSDRNSFPPSNTPGRRQETRKPKRGHRVRGIRLHKERGLTFWRFNLEVELQAKETRVAYSINGGPSVGFWVPAKGQSMNIMFHSCNGFSLSVDPNAFSGPDPLWRDVLNRHQRRPFHVMLGGGDQIYNDAVMHQSQLFREWLEIKNSHHKATADFSPAMRQELETFYLEHYSMWFSQGLFGMANSQIPMVNVWDDHDIIDGFGSYPDHFMNTPVFSGVGTVAFKYYMLFQHQSLSAETAADEPSWLLGASPGPYIKEPSRSLFLSLGKHVAFLGLDCRTERRRDQIVSEETYALVLDRCRREIVKGETRHLIVLLGVPIAYPRLVWLENLLTSRVMDPVKALGRVGLFGNFLNKFDGGVEILDDLDDHWTARNHKQERNWFVEELQELAAELSVRVTILGGDVHLAAIGQFYSHPKLKIPKDHDHRYMANIISSAIVNTPPPEVMGDILNKRNKTHHFDPDTDENMIPMFTHDVDGKFRNNKRLLPRRNWCSIREYHPGATPPPTPPESEAEYDSEQEDEPPRMGARIRRTMSLTREEARPGNLIRRLSGRSRPPSSYVAPNEGGPVSQRSSMDANGVDLTPFQPRPTTATVNRPVSDPIVGQGSAPLPRPGNFHRMPTNMSEKAVLKGTELSSKAHVNLENGLDIVLNCEVNQKDPSGATTPYRLLVPALWFEGPEDLNTLPYRKPSVIDRLNSFRERRLSRVSRRQTFHEGNPEQESVSGSEDEEYYEEVRPRRWSFGLTQRRQYRDQTPPAQRDSQQTLDEEGAPALHVNGNKVAQPQQQRMYEDRNQQIGKASTGARTSNVPSKSLPTPDAAMESINVNKSRQKAFASLTGQREQLDGSPDATSTSTPRRDSADYHEHLENITGATGSAPTAFSKSANGASAPARKLSKVDRMLGVGHDTPPPATANTGNGSGIPIRTTSVNQTPLPPAAAAGEPPVKSRRSSFSAATDSIRRTLSLGRKDKGQKGRGPYGNAKPALQPQEYSDGDEGSFVTGDDASYWSGDEEGYERDGYERDGKEGRRKSWKRFFTGEDH